MRRVRSYDRAEAKMFFRSSSERADPVLTCENVKLDSRFPENERRRDYSWPLAACWNAVAPVPINRGRCV
jgi:hypothetical protein